MATIQLTFKGLGKAHVRLSDREIAAVRKAVLGAIKVDGPRAIQRSIRGVGWSGSGKYRPPVDTGDYKGSWRASVQSDGTGLLESFASPPVKAGVIEHGRRPAPIPIEPLADWVRRKLGKDETEAVRIAKLISRKAAKKRRPGLKVAERAHAMIFKSYEQRLAKELKKARAKREPKPPAE